MNEDLGTLNFKFRAMLAQWKADLREADADYMNYRRKWESPVNIGGMGRGVGGGSAGSPMVAGPNIAGTSNGDMTWSLRDSVRENQNRQDNATRVARQVMRRIDKGDIDDPGFSGGRSAGRMSTGSGMGGLAGDIASSFIDQSRQRMRQVDMQTELMQSRQRGLADSLKEEFGTDTLSAIKPSFMNQKITVQKLLKATIAGLVIDAVSGMAGAVASYDQSTILSGNNQSVQARAALKGRQSILGAIPIVGGILQGIDSYFAAPIQTQLELTDRRIAFNDERMASLGGASVSRLSAAATRMGGNSIERSSSDISARAQRIRLDFIKESSAARATFDAANPDPYATINRQSGILGNYEVEEKRRANAYAERLNAVNAFNQQQNTILNSRMDDQVNAPRELIYRDARNTQNMQVAEINRLKTENRLRPSLAQSNYLVESFQADIDYHAGATGRDRDMLINRGEIAKQQAIGQATSIATQFLGGSATGYNPYTESPLSFTQRSPETMADALSAATDAIKTLTDKIDELRKGSQ